MYFKTVYTLCYPNCWLLLEFDDSLQFNTCYSNIWLIKLTPFRIVWHKTCLSKIRKREMSEKSLGNFLLATWQATKLFLLVMLTMLTHSINNWSFISIKIEFLYYFPFDSHDFSVSPYHCCFKRQAPSIPVCGMSKFYLFMFWKAATICPLLGNIMTEGKGENPMKTSDH